MGRSVSLIRHCRANPGVLGRSQMAIAGQCLADIGTASTFHGLLTLLNAPFDWFSVGLTRALLRGGLQLGGWWPYGLALLDAALAALIIAVLALAMVAGVQGFDAF